jgi:hypothetical protein
MKSFWLAIVLSSFVTAAYGQSQTPVPSEAQKSFSGIKNLAGVWQGPVKLDPPMPQMATGKPVQITMRVTSRGNALVHEMISAGVLDDPTKNDHPVTMFYVDNDRLLLTHYCDAGNRPRMVAKASPDGKMVDFDFIDITGSTQYGHMQHATFTMVDKPMHAHMELERVK